MRPRATPLRVLAQAGFGTLGLSARGLNSIQEQRYLTAIWVISGSTVGIKVDMRRPLECPVCFSSIFSDVVSHSMVPRTERPPPTLIAYRCENGHTFLLEPDSGPTNDPELPKNPPKRRAA